MDDTPRIKLPGEGNGDYGIARGVIPGLQAVYRPEVHGFPPTWNQDRVTEDSAYQLARQHQKPLTEGIGRLTEGDLIEIASSKPSVNVDKYLEHKDKSFGELLEEFPELRDLYDPNDLDWSDAFHYATRSEDVEICERDQTPPYLQTPSQNCYPVVRSFPRHAPHTQEEIERYKRYQDLGDIGKELLDKLFGDATGFARAAEPHHLEKYIIAFDEHLADPATIILLGNRLGFDIYDDPDYPPAEQFIDYLVDHIDDVERPEVTTKDGTYIKSRSSIPPSVDTTSRRSRTLSPEVELRKSYPSASTVGSPQSGDLRTSGGRRVHSVPTTKQMIDMTETDFDDLLQERGIPKTPGLYQNRLTLLSSI